MNKSTGVIRDIPEQATARPGHPLTLYRSTQSLPSRPMIWRLGNSPLPAKPEQFSCPRMAAINTLEIANRRPLTKKCESLDPGHGIHLALTFARIRVIRGRLIAGLRQETKSQTPNLTGAGAGVRRRGGLDSVCPRIGLLWKGWPLPFCFPTYPGAPVSGSCQLACRSDSIQLPATAS